MRGYLPMALYKEFCQILEKIRIDRNLSVADICDGIISERTYYRYLHSNGEMRCDIFAKLAQRLDLSSVEIVKYAFYFHKKDPGITKFIFRLHTRHFVDIEPIYQSILNHHEENLPLRYLLDACLKKYEYIISKITKANYISALEKIVEISNPNENNNIFVLLTRVLYFEAAPDNNHYSAEFLAQTLLKVDFRMSVMFYIIALDCLIYSNLGNNRITLDLFRLLVARFEEMLEFIDIKPFRAQKVLYQAYIHYLDGDKSKMEHFLFLYAINMSVLMGGENYYHAKTKVETLFHIDISEFLRVQSKILAIPSRFVIK